MAISLYEASVPGWLQTLGAVAGFLDKGMAHCTEHGVNPQEVVEARVFPDMRPFRFQIQQVVFHTVDALDALHSGVLHLPTEPPAYDYIGLQAIVAEARESLQEVSPEELNTREGGEVAFDLPNRRLLFTAETFVLSFSLPNLHFHAATAYGILRARGVPLGKQDFMGRMKLKEPAAA